MVKRLVLNLIRLFQLTRVFRAPACRFYPSCSDYTYDAVCRHGVVSGIMLGLSRLLRCQPLHPGGVDFVPQAVQLPKLPRFSRTHRSKA
jgi:hypothetical protein